MQTAEATATNAPERLKNVPPERIIIAALVALCLSPAIAPAAPPDKPTDYPPGWHIVGDLGTPVWNKKSLVYHGPRGALAVTPLSADIIRVRFSPTKEFGRDHSYAVISRHFGPVNATAHVAPDTSIITTASLKVIVRQSPLWISFINANGKILDADDPRFGAAISGGGAFRVAKQLWNDEHVYGLGEKNGALDKRGRALGGYDYVMWNSDVYGYDASTDPMYVSVPFYLVVRHGIAYGIFLDNTWRGFFDIGHQQPGILNFGAAGGELDYYFIYGPNPKQVIERYTDLTGRMPLPPLWSLGFNQSRYSYYPEARVRLLADTFRMKRIPADAIWLDIHYQKNFKPFTWDTARFPHPKKMLADLRKQGFRVVTIVDPHPKVEKGYAPYDEGIAGNYFVKNPDGSAYEAPVWPAEAAHNPGPSVFPDFSDPAARKWWGSLYANFLDAGVAGIWNDMDEPAIFDSPTGTMPLDTVFDNEGRPATSRQIHNVYGQLMSRATFEGLSRLRPNRRPFVLTRASFAGGQRYAAVWTGDNSSDWSSLRQSITTLLGFGLSGFPFVGSDIGGFIGAPDGELYARWLEAGVFYPFMRAHSTFGSPDKEPWSFGPRVELINKKTIELRYELLPEIYNVMHQAAVTGLPALRPLFLEFPADNTVSGTSDEFMFGDDLLVSPVLQQGETIHNAYLPAGDWFDYRTGRKFQGGKTSSIPVTLQTIPMFVRAGAFIFRQPVIQFTGQMPGNPLRVLIAPSTNSAGSFYEDDGESLDYRAGKFMSRLFHQIRNPKCMTIEISAPTGSYRPAPRELALETWMRQKPRAISVQIGNAAPVSLPEQSGAQTASSDWKFSDGLLTIETPDPFLPAKFVVLQ